ncbi:hypothetical protein ACI75Y_04925 [Capnocytophaga stomatis]|uniref:hypothetical protein n=1 Tax=Capnocytophaga stomatis TaxID=1848904 RepID=UPI00385BD34C
MDEIYFVPTRMLFVSCCKLQYMGVCNTPLRETHNIRAKNISPLHGCCLFRVVNHNVRANCDSFLRGTRDIRMKYISCRIILNDVRVYAIHPYCINALLWLFSLKNSLKLAFLSFF